MRLTIAFTVYCLLAGFAAGAQGSRKAARAYAAALQLRATRQPEKASKKMLQVVTKDPSFADAYALLGEWYYTDHKFSAAADILKKGSLKCQSGPVRFARPLTRSYLAAGQPDRAMQLINTYATIKDSAEWNRMAAQAQFIRQALAEQEGVKPQSLGIRVNSPFPELYPCMTADTQTLFFTRRINNIDEEFFKAKADSCGGWFGARNLGSPPNTPDQECAQTLSADGHYLFFTRCDNRSLDAWTDGGCDLFMAYRVSNDSGWTIPQPFGATINTPDYEGMPALSPDNNELYFVSDRPGGFGGKDIWVSRFYDGLWQEPVNAGPAINTPGNETAPRVAFDNKTLYFSSDGRPGMGGLDLFVCRKEQNGWSRAVNLGATINSACDENSSFVSLDGKALYLASDRNGPAGNYDIYTTALPPKLRPQAVSYLEGYVYDSVTHERLPSAAMYVCDARNGDTLYNFRSNRGDASYLITLPVGSSYAIHTAAISFDETSDTFAFDPMTNIPVVKNIVLLPANWNDIKPISDTLIATLNFDVNKTDLPAADKAALRDAVAPWLAVKGIIVYVNAYTDNTGTPMINDELSARRANMVATEIANIGIGDNMIKPKGWGEARMVATNDTEEGRRMNRRVEIIVKR